jgi:hypothetical protein
MGQDTGICLQSRFENLVEEIELCVLVAFVLLSLNKIIGNVIRYRIFPFVFSF